MKMKTAVVISILLLLPVFNSGIAGASQQTDPIPVEVGGIGMSPMAQTAVLLYAAAEGRVLPIYIGNAEASAIQRYLDGIRTPRPMTHDLIGNLLDILDGRLERVTVSDFRNNTYIALLVIRVDDRIIRVDARPSDAIAVALKQGAPIEVARVVMDAFGYLHEGGTFEPPPGVLPAPRHKEEVPPSLLI